MKFNQVISEKTAIKKSLHFFGTPCTSPCNKIIDELKKYRGLMLDNRGSAHMKIFACDLFFTLTYRTVKTNEQIMY